MGTGGRKGWGRRKPASVRRWDGCTSKISPHRETRCEELEVESEMVIMQPGSWWDELYTDPLAAKRHLLYPGIISQGMGSVKLPCHVLRTCRASTTSTTTHALGVLLPLPIHPPAGAQPMGACCHHLLLPAPSPRGTTAATG